MTQDKIQLPAWQIAIVLLLPVVYIANGFAPWSLGLWVDGERSYFEPFWGSIVLLHVVSSLIVLYFLRRSGVPLAAIGLLPDPRRLSLIGASLVGLGLLGVLFRQLVPFGNADDFALPMGWPVDQGERLFWIPICLFAGFCEELVYRGVAIPALRGRGFAVWQAVLITSVAFSLMHGAQSVLLFSITLAIGFMFSAIYLWRRSLVPGMVLHALADLAFIVTP